jgi:hypothetical protein
MPDLDAAERFLAAHARVLDRRRFERLFRDAEASAVRDAVAAYANPDGGFGHALEPDGRSPGSQPAAMQMALRVLDEADAWDDGLVARACDWLERSAPPEGGALFVDAPLDGWPHAPWWVPSEGMSPATTGPIAGALHARGVAHPWLERATHALWSRVESFSEGGAYDVRGALAFLQHVPDHDRAHAALEALAPHVERLATLDPDAPGEVHGPLDFAPRPDSLARALFDDDVIEAHLDALAAGQRDDGGWAFNWAAWSPAAEAEWRGVLTVDALVGLRANGRHPSR